MKMNMFPHNKICIAQQTYVWLCDLRTLHVTIITKYQIIIVYTFYYQKNYVGLLFTEKGAS